MPKKIRIICSYTEREWILIDGRISQMGKRSTLTHLIAEIKKLDKLCDFLENSIEEKKIAVKKREFYPPPDSIKILERLCEATGLKPSTLVSRLIINPLLLQ